MEKIKGTFLILSLVGLSSCATTNIVEVSKDKPERPYSRLLVVVVTSSEELINFNEIYYDQNIRGKFNNLNNLKFREHLEKSLKRNLENENGFPKVISSSELFSPVEDYTYNQFMEKYEESGCQALLFINRGSYWTDEKYVTSYYDTFSSTRVEEEPNFAYLCYLLDKENFDSIVWLGNIYVNGSSLAGYDTLNNHMARRLSRLLRKNNYVWGNRF